MTRSVLVLGANGFIGREVVAALAAGGVATPVMGVRRPAAAATPAIEQRIVDGTSAESVCAALAGVTGVVNCVAGDSATLVGSVRALREAAERASPRPRIVHLSTMSVYGSATGLVAEAAPLRADLGPYSQAKVDAEKALEGYPDAVLLRPGCVFGPTSEQWSRRIARLLLARRLGDLGAAGDGYCNLVHVADVAAAVVRALERPQAAGQAYNLSLSDPPTWNEFLVRFGIALRAVPVRRIGGRRLRIETKLLAPPLKIVEILARLARIDATRLPAPIPPSLIRLMGQEIRLDTRRAEDVLGMRWRSLDESLAESARQFLHD